jgi:hypothetical protein
VDERSQSFLQPRHSLTGGAFSVHLDNNLEVLLVFGSRNEPDLIAGRLKSSVVRAQISADDEGGMNLALQSGRV